MTYHPPPGFEVDSVRSDGTFVEGPRTVGIIVFVVVLEITVGYGLMRRSWLARIGMALLGITLLITLYERIFKVPAWPYQTEVQKLAGAFGGGCMWLSGLCALVWLL